MASTNVNISDAAYKRLKKLKRPGDSFSDVLLRELPEPCETAGELLDYFEKYGVPKANPRLRRAMLDQRSRRSRRA
jgi:predicted CopG family antitoxin